MTINDYYIKQAITLMPYQPRTVKEVQDFFRRHYKLYFQTLWWHDLNEVLIDSNPHAKCWISGETSTLLIHHVSYTNLFCEKLKRDVYILAYDWHTQVHFYTFLKLFERRTKMKKRNLLRRMRYLKTKLCYQRKQYGLSLWYFLLCILSF